MNPCLHRQPPSPVSQKACSPAMLRQNLLCPSASAAAAAAAVAAAVTPALLSESDAALDVFFGGGCGAVRRAHAPLLTCVCVGGD